MGQPGSAVWHVDLGAIPCEASGELSGDEVARADRFLRREDRARFIRSHRALRRILSGYLGRPPDRLRFRADPNGKPQLDGPDHGRLHFNLSHSARHALVGIASEAIGVDIEAVRPMDDAMAIARAHFHPGEIADLTRLSGPGQRLAFFACWTRKEAVVKALGTGLSLPLDAFRIAIPPANAAVLRWERTDGSGHAWSMDQLDPGPDAVGAVAIMRSGESFTRYRLPPGWTK